jgi:enoyl-CoA hydratase/carnithine racemase
MAAHMCEIRDEEKQILPRSRQLAAELANNSPQGLASTKQSVVEILSDKLDEQNERTCQMNAAARSTEDCKEGVRAFLEKRAPKWQAGK